MSTYIINCELSVRSIEAYVGGDDDSGGGDRGGGGGGGRGGGGGEAKEVNEDADDEFKDFSEGKKTQDV